jgi:hypothetical protein
MSSGLAAKSPRFTTGSTSATPQWTGSTCHALGSAGQLAPLDLWAEIADRLAENTTYLGIT